MLGTIVNTCTILTGSFVGSFLSRGISEKYKTALFDALGLATVGLGANAVVHNLPNSEYPVLFIASLAIGTIIGTRLDICGRFNALLAHCKGGGKLAEGLSSGLIFAGVLTRCLRTARAAASWRKGFLRRYFCSALARFPF